MSIIEDIEKGAEIKVSIYSTTKLQQCPGKNMWVLHISTNDGTGWWTTKVWDHSKNYKDIVNTLSHWMKGVE